MRDRVHARTQLFAALAVGIGATALVLARSLSDLERPAAVALGVTLDLTLLLPSAYYLLVVRPRGWPPIALAPVAMVCLLLAAVILPADHQQTLRLVEALVLPAEGGLLGWIGWRVARALRHAGGEGGVDPLAQLHAHARDIVRVDGVAAVLASELAVLHYALGAWRSRPHGLPGTLAFTTHHRSGHGGLVFGLLLVTAVEGLAVHLLLAGWSATAAWIVTGLSAYGALWLVADYRATVLLPPIGNETALWIRAGLRWRAHVPRSQIARVARTQPAAGGCTHSVAFLTSPNVWIEFSSPVRLEGPYGLRRRVGCVGLFVDDPEALQRVLAGSGTA